MEDVVLFIGQAGYAGGCSHRRAIVAKSLHLKVRLVAPGDKVPARKTSIGVGLKPDIAALSSMKFILEQILGRPAWYRLKETCDIRKWRKETTRLLRAIDLSIKSTVQIADDQWREEISNLIQVGIKQVARAKYIDELLSDLAATLARIVFLQIGLIPAHYSNNTVPLSAAHWMLNCHRSVQYVQTDAQRLTMRSHYKQMADSIGRGP
jgi:hypothetical protein